MGRGDNLKTTANGISPHHNSKPKKVKPPNTATPLKLSIQQGRSTNNSNKYEIVEGDSYYVFMAD